MATTARKHKFWSSFPGWQLVWTFTCWGVTCGFTSKNDTWGRTSFLLRCLYTSCSNGAIVIPAECHTTPWCHVTLPPPPPPPHLLPASSSSQTRWTQYDTYNEAVLMMHRSPANMDHPGTHNTAQPVIRRKRPPLSSLWRLKVFTHYYVQWPCSDMTASSKVATVKLVMLTINCWLRI